MTRTRRRRLQLGLLGLLLISLAGFTTVLLTSGSGKSHYPEPHPLGQGASAEDHAALGCSDLQALQRLVAHDASASLVLRYAAAGLQETRAAARLDGRWLSVASAAEQIDTGLRHDNARATTLGITIARSQCRLAGITLT